MLVLSRKIGESIYLDNDIKITVLNVQAKQIKLGLSMPNDMLVYREELFIRTYEENKSAILTNLADIFVAAKLWERANKKS